MGIGIPHQDPSQPFDPTMRTPSNAFADCCLRKISDNYWYRVERKELWNKREYKYILVEIKYYEDCVFWDVTPYMLVEVYRRFRGFCSKHLFSDRCLAS
jgi:hypothetical protein